MFLGLCTTTANPTAEDLKAALAGLKQVKSILRPRTPIGRHTTSLRRLAGHLERILDATEMAHGEVESLLDDLCRLPEINAEIAAGWVHDGDSLSRVERAEHAQLHPDSDQWPEFTVGEDGESPLDQPIGVGAPTEFSFLATNWDADRRTS